MSVNMDRFHVGMPVVVGVKNRTVTGKIVHIGRVLVEVKLDEVVGGNGGTVDRVFRHEHEVYDPEPADG